MEIPFLDFKNELFKALIAAGFFAPGFLILFARSRFVTGRIHSISTAILEYTVVSLIYISLTLPVFVWVGVVNWVSLEILFIIAPLLFGGFIGGLHQWKWPKKIPNVLGLTLVTPYPTGWDKAFATLEEDPWIIVTTADHGEICGKFRENSNASNILSNRDIFIEEVVNDDFSPICGPGEKRGIWIREDQVVMVEIAYNRGGREDE